jgi:hypothetical protein
LNRSRQTSPRDVDESGVYVVEAKVCTVLADEIEDETAAFARVEA